MREGRRGAGLFAAGLLAGAFLFYAIAWRTGALVPGHWLTLPSRDVIATASRPTTPSPIPTFPFPTPSPGAASAGLTPSFDRGTPASGLAPAALTAGSGAGPSAPAAAIAARGLAMPPLTLLLPVLGAHVRELKDDFDETRDGTRRHEAIDILAPRGTPVLATVDGTIAKLFTSQQGGLTIYEFDGPGEYCYYYAHLDRYAPGLVEGMTVRRGDRIGEVGTTGNAPKNTPHLHFAVFRLGAEKHWWQGQAINPFPMLQKAEER